MAIGLPMTWAHRRSGVFTIRTSAAIFCRVEYMYESCVRRCRMSRDQRMKDNWALLHAFELAAESGGSVAVAFNLVRDQCACRLAVPITSPRVELE